MRLLLDTHILIWMIREPTLLTARETNLILDGDNTLLLSALSIWELRIKWNTRDRDGRRKGLVDPNAALAFATSQNVPIYGLEAQDVIEPLDPPLAHKDPFDEMLLVHAQRLGARLLTRDRRLAVHPVALVA